MLCYKNALAYVTLPENLIRDRKMSLFATLKTDLARSRAFGSIMSCLTKLARNHYLGPQSCNSLTQVLG